MLTATVTAGGSPVTLSNTVYDATCGGAGMTTSSATNNHDPAYTASGGPPRGNPWAVSGLNGSDTVCTAYDSAGVPWVTENASGQSVSLQTDSTTNYSLPTVIQPNGNSGMETTATYASSWSPMSMKGPNGDQGTTTYDSYGRPSQTTIPDGAVTTYTYTYSANASTQTATVDGRWQTTTLDGFGRTIQVQKGNGSTVVSTVQTQYAACACSPLGKMSAVSQPYAPNATVYWTTYTYDGAGRTLTVTAPDGASATSYIYTGNSTKVTDPAGSWKTSTVDAYGNLILVTEPNPAGGTFATTYTYTPVNQLTIVSIVRGNVTETRTYVYNGSDLMSATNPENGTVTYTYDLSHHVLTRTDALGQQTVYSYDSYGRLSEVQYYPSRSPYDGTLADTIEQVNYSYDAGQYGIGRLTSVTFDGGVKDSLYDAHAYTYAYTYSQAGRVTNQTVTLQVATGTNFNNLPPVNPPIATFTVGYQWDDEGRMTAMQSPTVTMSSYSSYPNPLVMPTMGYQYDINGRMTEMTSNGNAFATASYTAAGQLYQLSYGGMTETRTYNPMMQLITQSVPGYLNMTYNYSTTGQNNGRITSSVDGVTGENTAYAYDLLNRLTSASNSLWSQSYTYDGFGNLLTKSQANGSPNPSPSTSASYNANNQQVGYNYDANGNISGANNMTFGYTVENKLNSETTSAWPYAQSLYAYDPWGKRVMKETNPDPNNYEGEYNPLWEFYFYSITGQRLVTMDCNNPNANPIPSCTVVGESLYFKEKMLVSNGVYVVTDRLGSVRANTQQGSFAYYPYGDERTNNVNGLDKFATYFRDAVGQDYADQRYYNARTGWFFTVDPTAGSTGNPASLNRYAYVQGDPINLNDPRGLDPYCGPNMQWDGEGCMNGTGSSGVTGPCGSGWMTNASLEGPCQDPCGGSGSAFGEDFAPTPPSSCAVPATPAASTQTPSCMDLLMSSLTSFLSGTKFAGDAVAFEATGASFDIDPRLIAAMAFGENGQAANNPFGLGPNGSAAFSTIGAALASLGNTLDKYIYTWNETTVSELWSGNTWKVDPKKKWITIQYPGYCVGTTSQGVAGCQATGANISQFMVSMGANPNSLGFPCPE